MISVCMATYNGQKYIKEQVDSILPQLGAGDELVISDDGSTDATLDLLKAYNDPRIKIYPNPARHGVVGNFEHALSRAQGDILFLCDQDDVWTADKVAVCVEALVDADVVLHDAVVVDGQGQNVLHESFYALRGTRIGYWNTLLRNGFLGCSMAFNRKVLTDVLPIPPVAMHDIWIGLVASIKGRKVNKIEQKLLRYRRHGGNASPTAEQSTLSFGQKLGIRLSFLYHSLIRLIR